ncbi:tRNA (N6-isopentenyl adenosine(37)-C2)-methylthiotransferase MiaB [Candidatus Peregrinibacteria bacterium]|nr:tRNA (N6-isopentenyl adenosine(37)-C2)-methylthiotransferase MiaB [Candidatus Peregrinibacteria bacterium]
MKKSYYIQTLGCQMNYSDSERVDSVLQNMGFNKIEDMNKADLILFNTCSVRQKAEDRVFGQMRKITKLRRERPDLLVGITGCMVRKTSTKKQEEPDKLFNRIKQLDIAFRIEDLPTLPSIINNFWEIKSCINEGNLKNYFEINPKYSNKFQAFVPIGQGCDNFCTYCIVPYSRMRERSRPINDIYKECENLVKNGCIEITLLGQNVNSYGISDYDKKTGIFEGIDNPFVKLLQKINSLNEYGLKRLRFTSNHPKDLSDGLIDAMEGLETLMPYIHLPVQSGNNEILKRMNRHYTREWYMDLIKKLRKKIPGISISTDIIVGFCDETDEQFKDTYNLFMETEWDMAYLAQYSVRKGTFASKHLKDDVPSDVKKQRWNALNDLLKKVSLKKHKVFDKKIVEVLVEKYLKGICEGRSEHFKTVTFKSDKDLTGQLVKVKILKAREWLLEGETV